MISWKGTLRPSIDETGIYPRAEHGPIPISIATGGTPESSLRAGAFGLPITYAIIGGNPRRFKRHIEIINLWHVHTDTILKITYCCTFLGLYC